MELTPHQKRLIDESKELNERLNKLTDFLDTPKFRGLPEAEQMRMRAQAGFMKGYKDMLFERILAFMT
jgi:hypothetical protein